jgi:hypothetical protein
MSNPLICTYLPNMYVCMYIICLVCVFVCRKNISIHISSSSYIISHCVIMNFQQSHFSSLPRPSVHLFVSLCVCLFFFYVWPSVCVSSVSSTYVCSSFRLSVSLFFFYVCPYVRSSVCLCVFYVCPSVHLFIRLCACLLLLCPSACLPVC